MKEIAQFSSEKKKKKLFSSIAFFSDSEVK